MRTNNNKRKAQMWRENERMIEVQRCNEHLLKKLEVISTRNALNVFHSCITDYSTVYLSNDRHPYTCYQNHKGL
jgi:hypothetical protein